MSLSSVAGILDGYGGWHTVVAPRKSLRHHVRPGQLLLVVPDYKVKESVPWNNIPGLIRRVELHILWWINSCNDPDRWLPLFAEWDLWNVAGSVRLRAGKLDHFGPLLGFVGNKLSKVGGRDDKHRCSQIGKTALSASDR